MATRTHRTVTPALSFPDQDVPSILVLGGQYRLGQERRKRSESGGAA